VTDRLEAIKREYEDTSVDITWLITEVERLREHNEKMVRQTNELFNDKNAAIAMLREQSKDDDMTMEIYSAQLKKQEATIAKLRDGSEYWGMNQELTEQIATLRGENLALREVLVKIREIILRRESERPDPQA